MSDNKLIAISPQQFELLSSSYLNGGRKEEAWKLGEIYINNTRLETTLTFDDFYHKNADLKQFHLSFVTALEICSQLSIIFVHVWADLSKKELEVWQIKNTMESIRPITRAIDIEIKMEATRMKKIKNRIYGETNFMITDQNNGLMKVCLTGIM